MWVWEDESVGADIEVGSALEVVRVHSSHGCGLEDGSAPNVVAVDTPTLPQPHTPHYRSPAWSTIRQRFAMYGSPASPASRSASSE